MTKNGHLITGGIASMYPSLIVFNSYGLVYALVTCIMTIVGSNAPDYLEIRYTKKIIKYRGFQQKKREILVSKTVIPHRGVTHTVLYWLTAYAFVYLLIQPTTWFLVYAERLNVPTELYDAKLLLSAFLGFSFGGLIHLLCDVPNKKSIPFIPFVFRFSFGFWNSGKNEKLMIILVTFKTLFLLGYELRNQY